MSKYIGTPVVNISADTVDVTGDITTTDATPEVIIVNNTHEDTDGGREGKVTFKGQQTGGEETTLAQIRAQHEGSSDDEKGELLFKTNDGSDGASPTTALTINSEQKIGIGTTAPDNKLHVFESSTTQTASTESQLVLEKNSNSGITILSGQTSNGRILFGDSGDNDIGQIDYDHNNNSMSIVTNASERMRIDSDGLVGIGKTPANATALDVQGSSTGTLRGMQIRNSAADAGASVSLIWSLNRNAGDVEFEAGSIRVYKQQLWTTTPSTIDSYMTFNTVIDESTGERMRINSDGDLLVGKTTTGSTTQGIHVGSAKLTATRSGGPSAAFVRTSSDGRIIGLQQDGTTEGEITVNGSTVSYNGGHLSRWSQLSDNTKDTSIVKGTVMTNLDKMAVWTHAAKEVGDDIVEDGKVVGQATEAQDAWTEDNEQLNCMAVSSVEGDPNVAGVFVNWDEDDEDFLYDMNVAMTGDMVIRIAKGVTVARGDLLMSAGDGTAKPQDDDIVRSKTIAKVTSTNVSHTYDDESYLVPCVLMAC